MGMEALVLCLVISMQTALVHVAAGASGGIRLPPAMYVLGDSLLDVGNNNYLPGADVPRANKPYYGIDFPGGVPTGRFSNGYNLADTIAKSLGFPISPPPYLSLLDGELASPAALTIGVNYASADAGILDSTNAGKCIPLSRQVQYFKATRAQMVAAVGSSAASQQLFKSFFLIGIGINDLFVFSRARNTVEQQRDAAAFYTDLISNYSATIEALYSMGARKFAINNVFQIGCVPAERLLDAAGRCDDGLNRLAARFNDGLRSLLAGLARRLPGLVYSLGDAYSLSRDVFANPQAYGFTDIADACCGSGRLLAEGNCLPNSTLCPNRDDHTFWDRSHHQ